jgi:hypothetical protein
MAGQRDPLRPCDYEPMTGQLGNNEGSSRCKRQPPVGRSARGAAGAKSGLGRRETERVQFTSVSRGLAGGDLRTSAQPASSPEGRWKEFGPEDVAGQSSQPRVGWDGMGMQAGRERRQAARRQASLERRLLTMEPETTIRSRKRAVVVNRAESMRRRLLLVGEKWR